MVLIFCGLLTMNIGGMSAQSAFISIDEGFEDWSEGLSTYEDVTNDAPQNDLLKIQASNDADYLFIRFELDTEIDLTGDFSPHDLSLHFDTDNNAQTGSSYGSNFGAELSIYFIDRTARYFAVNNNTYVSTEALGMRVAPTVSSKEFELAIRRDAIPVEDYPLFTNNSIRIMLQENTFGDWMPGMGEEAFEYTFDESPVEQPAPISFGKESAGAIRVLAYNILWDALDDPDRRNYIRQIVQATDPDIIAFSEATTTSWESAKQMLDFWQPLGTPQGWYVERDDYDLITASRWPIVEEYKQQERFYPTLIDLPENYGSDLLLTNGHLKCCDADEIRQDQVDQYLAFILDAKTEGGIIDVPENTPFMIVGDLNLVTDGQHLRSLLDGTIVNTDLYGQGAPLDWDNTDLADEVCLHSDDQRFSYSWYDVGSSFPPGRIDMHIYSDAVMSIEKSFTINTSIMSPERLNQLGLSAQTTALASDHYPVVADYLLNAYEPVGLVEVATPSGFEIRQADGRSVLWNTGDSGSVYSATIYSVSGQVVASFRSSEESKEIDFSGLGYGVYLLRVESADQRSVAMFKLVH